MRVLSPGLHKILDYVTVVAFALSPLLVPLSGFAAVLAYALAVVHLAVTLSTAFPGASRRPLALEYHGALEALVGIALIALPLAAGWVGRPRVYYLAAGMVILVVWVLTRYRAVSPPATGAD